jgi:hypothetical protein
MRIRIVIAKIAFISVCNLYINSVSGQQLPHDKTLLKYQRALSDIKEALDQNMQFSFKQICFLTENVYLNESLDYLKFNENIIGLKLLAENWMKANPLKNYAYKDSVIFHKNFAIFKVLTDTITLITQKSKRYEHMPFKYDFNDFFANAEWANMFVTKLLSTKKGNCHSLPYLYKILADEMGATCWLSLAPNHLFIKNRSAKIGWYNTELTSATFPIDAWVMASGYVPIEAIQSKIYMDTLSNQQAIALCVLDLAKGYERQTKNYYDGFIVQCCDLVLKYHPQNVMAILLKAETMKKLYLKEKADKYPKLTYTPIEMAKLYGQLFDLGYREMPEKMYMNWLQGVRKEKIKYEDQRLKPK